MTRLAEKEWLARSLTATAGDLGADPANFNDFYDAAVSSSTATFSVRPLRCPFLTMSKMTCVDAATGMQFGVLG